MTNRIQFVQEPAFTYYSAPATEHAIKTVLEARALRADRCRAAVESALPDHCAELYFNLGPTGRAVVSADETDPRPGQRAAWVLGPRARSLFVAKETVDCDIVVVRLQAGVVRRVLGVPAFELREQLVDLDLLIGASWVEEVRERLRCAPGPQGRANLLANEVARRTNGTATREHACLNALRSAVDRDAHASVGTIARRFGLAHRRVIALFDGHIGLKPKEYQRVRRLRTVLSRLSAAEPLSWARLAYEVGYADQAHLANEFRRLTDLTPTRYIAQRLRTGEGFVPWRLA